MGILKKLRREISILLSAVLTIGTCFIPKISTVYAEEDLSTDFYDKCAELIKENWDENYDLDGKSKSVDSEFQTMRLIVKTKNNNLDVSKYNAKNIVKSNDNIIVLQFDTIEKTKIAYEDLKSNKDVDYIEVDKVISIDYEIEDINENEVSGTSAINHNSWGVERIEADQYSEYLYNNGKNNNLTVAVVDTGVDYNHSYLSERLLSGYNFIYGNYDPYDDNGHGTHVSGTVVDCTLELNAIKILPVKVLNENGRGTTLSVGNGIRYAISRGSNVINLSLTGGHSSYVDEAIEYAVSENIAVVVAAGNDDIDTKNQCPAHISEAIVVASTDSSDYKSYFSNYGSSVDICAPGEYILSCYPGYSYAYMSGTSMATPHISAAVAMYKLGNPNLSVSQLESLLKTNTKDLGSTGWDKYYGSGQPKLSRLINNKPVISASDKTLKVGDTFNAKSGVSASDKEDGDLTSKIVVKENTVNTSKVGIYKVVYQVTDSDKNTVTKEIKVTVRSNEKPVITAMNKTLKVGDTFNAKTEVSASDKEDGDITSKIVVKENTVNSNKVGTYKVVYSVTDSDNNTVTKERSITVNNVFTNFTVNNIDNKTTTIKGKGVSGATVKAYVGTKQIGNTVTVNSSGNYSMTIPTQSANTKITIEISKSGYETANKTISVIGVTSGAKRIQTTDIYKYDAGKGNYLTYINGRGYSQYVYLNKSGKYAFTPSSWMVAAGLDVSMPKASNGYTMTIDNNYIQMYNEANELLNNIKSGKIATTSIEEELNKIRSIKNQETEVQNESKIMTKATSKKTLTADIYKYDIGKGKHLTYINGKGYSQYVYLNKSGNYAFTPSSWMVAAGLTVTMPSSANGYTMKIDNSYITKYNNIVKEIESYI